MRAKLVSMVIVLKQGFLFMTEIGLLFEKSFDLAIAIIWYFIGCLHGGDC
tara:strand:+ start:589 stop:738 length:150 start_codon:yes stop_codon:yes gene_type:complete